MSTIIWGSIERCRGTFCPYSGSEQKIIENAYQNKINQINIPSCFNATIVFNYENIIKTVQKHPA